MIVDDEILAIRHLRNLVCWEDLGFTIAAEALTATRALELVESVNPQLIFMDIRMPVLNGLELSRRMMSLGRNMKIILLTSYRDFEYARSALEIGVAGYLLKHETNKETLTQLLLKLKHEIYAEEQQEQYAFRQYLRGFLEGENPPGQVLEKWERYANQSDKRFMMFYVKADAPYPVVDLDFQPFTASLPEVNAENLTGEDGQISEMEWIESVAMGKDKQVVLFAVAAHKSDKQLLSDSYEVATRLQNEIEKSDCSVSILISSSFKRLDALPKWYYELDEKSQFFILSGKKSIKFTLEWTVPAANLLEEWSQIAREIEYTLAQQDESQLTASIRSVFAELQSTRFHSGGLKIFCKLFSQALEQRRKTSGMPSYSELLRNNEMDPNRWYTVSDIEQWLLDEVAEIGNYSRAISQYSRKVRQAIRYIHEHYMEDLTVDVIAESLSISGDHLRRLFKSEVGRTVSDYLTGCRVEKAKELLRSDQHKVYEISELVGYRTSQYFSQVFKKWTGVTPQEYSESVVKSK